MRSILYLFTAAVLYTTPVYSLDGWVNVSSKDGKIPVPGSTQQTACQVFDIDKDGTDDFVIGCRKVAPAVTWFKKNGDHWEMYLIEDTMLPIEAGGAFHDIDNDGDLDLVFGEDASSNKVYWWENPYPNYDPKTPWKRYFIKDGGKNKHHDQIFGDFDGDGKTELVFWNQRDSALFLAEIPENPKETQPWTFNRIFTSESESEGVAKADIDGDGVEDIVGGGRWFKHTGNGNFEPHIIDDEQRFTRSAAGDLVKGGMPEAVFVIGDGIGRLKWYQYKDDKWIGTDLLGHDVFHGHTLDVADINQDGNLDIICGEMRLNNENEDGKLWIFYGDGAGNFKQTHVYEGNGVHEGKLGDLDGDGDLDICAKPYNWDSPRLELWLNPVK